MAFKKAPKGKTSLESIAKMHDSPKEEAAESPKMESSEEMGLPKPHNFCPHCGTKL